MNVWVPQQELATLLGSKVVPVTFSDIYLTIGNSNNSDSVLAVGGELTEIPQDFEGMVLKAFLETGSLTDMAIRFCSAYDAVRTIQMSPDKRIPIQYVVSFVRDGTNPNTKQEDMLNFERIERSVPRLNEWILFNLVASSDGYHSDISQPPPFKYHQTIVGHQTPNQ